MSTCLTLSGVQGLKARGNVEDWLCKVEEAMFGSLRKLTKSAIADYERRSREEWVVSHASQVHGRLFYCLFMYCFSFDVVDLLHRPPSAVVTATQLLIILISGVEYAQAWCIIRIRNKLI